MRQRFLHAATCLLLLAATTPVTAQQNADDLALITDPATLTVISQAGGSFGALIGGHEFADADNRRLEQQSRYGVVAATITRDLGEFARADGKLGVGVRGNPHRLFDARWLKAETARFELIGVVNRIDRKPFTPDTCGETRLVYR